MAISSAPPESATNNYESGVRLLFFLNERIVLTRPVFTSSQRAMWRLVPPQVTGPNAGVQIVTFDSQLHQQARSLA